MLKLRLIALIKEYQKAVQNAVDLFTDHHKLMMPMNWRQAGLPREGYLDDAGTIIYCFHGIGCRVEFLDKIVDWDFGVDGRNDGFDVWRLWRFALDWAKDFHEFQDQTELKNAFSEAVADGVVCQSFKQFQDNLYYLTTAEQEVVKEQRDL